MRLDEGAPGKSYGYSTTLRGGASRHARQEEGKPRCGFPDLCIVCPTLHPIAGTIEHAPENLCAGEIVLQPQLRPKKQNADRPGAANLRAVPWGVCIAAA